MNLVLNPFSKKLFSLGCVFFLGWPVLLSGGADAEQAYKAVDINLASSIELIQHRKRRNLNHLYVFETSPLGHRVPVILVPGRAEEYQQNAWWKKIHQMTDKNPDFEKEFKLYAFIYDSKAELDEQAKAFAYELLEYFKGLSVKQQVVLISYSLGGVIAREALDNEAVFKRVNTIFAIGVPFHGSPIFDPAWFSTYMRPKNFSPIRKWEDRFIYRLYLFNKTNLTQGLKWDNFDGSRPQFKAISNLSGDQLIGDGAAYVERSTTAAIKQKMIIYAGYLENKETNLAKLEPLPFRKLLENTATSLPTEIVATVFPVYGFSSHSVFKFVNQQLSNLPSFTEENPRGKNNHVYKYNDGVIPLSSALYLPARKTPYSGNLKELADVLDVAKARLFVNLDHTNIGEYTTFRKKLDTIDLLHPNEGERTPNQWLLYDLQSLLPSLKTDTNP